MKIIYGAFKGAGFVILCGAVVACFFWFNVFIAIGISELLDLHGPQVFFVFVASFLLVGGAIFGIADAVDEGGR